MSFIIEVGSTKKEGAREAGGRRVVTKRRGQGRALWEESTKEEGAGGRRVIKRRGQWGVAEV